MSVAGLTVALSTCPGRRMAIRHLSASPRSA